MNNQNKHQFNSDIEKAISIGKRIKDKYYKLKKNLRDDSRLNSTFDNELYVDGGVVRTRVKVVSNNQSKIMRT